MEKDIGDIQKIVEKYVKNKDYVRSEKGITLIALVIIIILLFLITGVSVMTLKGDNGTIKSAITAKEQVEIDSEKEIVVTSASEASEQNKYSEVKLEELKNALDFNTRRRKNVS